MTRHEMKRIQSKLHKIGLFGFYLVLMIKDTY